MSQRIFTVSCGDLNKHKRRLTGALRGNIFYYDRRLLVRAGLKCTEFQCICVVRIVYHLYAAVILNMLAGRILLRQKTL